MGNKGSMVAVGVKNWGTDNPEEYTGDESWPNGKPIWSIFNLVNSVEMCRTWYYPFGQFWPNWCPIWSLGCPIWSKLTKWVSQLFQFGQGYFTAPIWSISIWSTISFQFGQFPNGANLVKSWWIPIWSTIVHTSSVPLQFGQPILIVVECPN